MADGHQRAAWSHTLAVSVGVGKAMGAKGPSVLDMMPERYKDGPAPAKSAEHEAAESALGFSIMREGLRGMAREVK